MSVLFDLPSHISKHTNKHHYPNSHSNGHSQSNHNKDTYKESARDQGTGIKDQRRTTQVITAIRENLRRPGVESQKCPLITFDPWVIPTQGHSHPSPHFRTVLYRLRGNGCIPNGEHSPLCNCSPHEGATVTIDSHGPSIAQDTKPVPKRHPN